MSRQSSSQKARLAGFEQVSDSTQETNISKTGGAKSGALDAENAPIDPDLSALIEAVR